MRAASLTRLVIAVAACSTLALPASAYAQWGRDRDARTWDNRTNGGAFDGGGRDAGWDQGDRPDRRWNGGPEFRDPGRARGFSDGFNRGVQDRRDNRRFDPERHKEVRQGTAPGYNKSFGSRDRYTFEYRDGFRQGYEDGFRRAYARR